MQADIGQQEAWLVQTGGSPSFLSVPSAPGIANTLSRSFWTSECHQFSKRAWGVLAVLSLLRTPSISPLRAFVDIGLLKGCLNCRLSSYQFFMESWGYGLVYRRVSTGGDNWMSRRLRLGTVQGGEKFSA